MFKKILKDKYPFLTEYFEQGINNPSRNISHSILFYGQDISAQYELATEIARILNCKEEKNENCNCLNCNWIEEHKHPAVLTISKLDNKPTDDESKTVISLKQSQFIKNSLLNTSDYHRVFIFCDAEIIKDGDNEKWNPLGLNENNFQEETANSLLKIIEEPPENTTFFFLTRDKRDLIDTIISRSQSFFVPSLISENTNFSDIKEIFEDYPNIERSKAFDFAKNLSDIAKNIGDNFVLSQIQNYLNAILKSNLVNQQLKNKILRDLKSTSKTQQMLSNHISSQTAFEDLLLNITE